MLFCYFKLITFFLRSSYRRRRYCFQKLNVNDVGEWFVCHLPSWVYTAYGKIPPTWRKLTNNIYYADASMVRNGPYRTYLSLHGHFCKIFLGS